jgi:hypothetical protein
MAHDDLLTVRGGGARRSGRGPVVLLLGLACLAATSVGAQDIEREPIRYSSATPRNVVSQLQERLDKGTAKLAYEPKHGYLKSVLRALDVPESSQVLVFSKTSLQRERISPRTPRAIYFNDEVLVGFCNRGGVMEISAADEAIGTAFYTIDQAPGDRPVIERQTESCLLCHSSSANQGVPGHLVRSLYVDRQGNPQLASGSFRTDHTSPLAERWGGWYVTGTSGRQKHMGNMICSGPGRPEDGDNADGVNVIDLKGRFKTGLYPTPHSDIVALMVLEHQAGMLNHLARAGLETRMALHYQREMNKALGQPADEPSESAQSRIRGVGDAVVEYLLFRDEARLTDQIAGTSSFAADFAARGPRDSKGRSLRDFDLETRLFRYPCSYLIYSRAFDSLPGEVKAYIYRRLWDILDGRTNGKEDPRISPEDSAAIVEILRETKRDLPDYWKAPSSGSR